ncbi:MAG: Fic family protein [Methylovulum sp.]|nr:Fic family protein [Methylovulum sp.]
MNDQNSILQLPVHYFRYLDWHKAPEQQAKRARRSSAEGLFEIHEPRFELCLDDIPELALKVCVRAIGRYTLVESEQGEIVLESQAKDIGRILEQIDGTSSFGELLDSGRLGTQVADNEAVLNTINGMLGTAILLPAAVNSLESGIPGASIGRFPLSPYHIVRVYWENMKGVRDELELSGCNGDPASLVAQLRRLHLVSLMGADLVSFYKPHSQVSDVAVWPGHFRTGEVHVALPTEFLAYLDMVAYSLGISLGEQFAVRWETGGLKWGAGKLRDGKLVYTPPAAPFTGQLEQLCAMLAALPTSVSGAGSAGAIYALAAFHQRFAQLHPFACANQSVAMNIVNYFLDKWFNSCIPHLYLDMVAFFVSPADYARYFARAVKFYSVKANEAQGIYPEFKARSKRMNQFIPHLMAAAQTSALADTLEKEPEAACDLLLFD